MSAVLWPILFLILGLILLIAEVFIPSGGMIGLLASGLLLASLWQAFTQTEYGLYFLLTDLLLMPLTLMVAVYLWPKTPLAKKVFLTPPEADEMAVSHGGGRLDHLIGQLGRSLTPLRPSGSVDFDGRRIDAMAESGLISAGSLVQAVRVQAGQLVVRLAPVQTLPTFDDM